MDLLIANSQYLYINAFKCRFQEILKSAFKRIFLKN
jgi:hypothetical protein